MVLALWFSLLLAVMCPTQTSAFATVEHQMGMRASSKGCCGLFLAIPSSSPNPENEEGEGEEDMSKQFYEETRRRTLSGQPSSSDDDTSYGMMAPPATPSKLFTGGTLFSETTRKAENPYEREINLASTFERTLPLQAVAFLSAIAFVVYVGFSGGITDGSERFYGGVDEIDDFSLQILDYQSDDQSEIDNGQAPPFFEGTPTTGEGSVYL